MAENVGRAKIEVGADTRKAQFELERFRQRLEQAGRSYDKLLKEDVTRKFSENFRKGFELGVLRGVTKGENQFYQLNRAINYAASSLQKIKSPAEMATDRFMKLQRTGLKIQAALGTLAGTIGDLVGGVLSLVGVLAAAVPSIAAFGGAFAGVAVGFIGVKVAMSGVANAIGTVWKSQTALNDTFRAAAQEYINLKFAAEAAALSQEDAALKLESAREALARVQDLPPDNRLRRQTELAYKQADLQLREAKHKSEEAFRAVKKGIEATSAYQPLAALSAVQLEFVKFMVTLRPQMQQLKKEVSEGFIPKLQESIETLMKYGFPVLKTGLKQVASAMGDASKTFASAFKDNVNMMNMKKFFEDSTRTIDHFGKSMKSSFGILLTLLTSASQITERFSLGIDTALSNFDKKLRISAFTGDLNRSFHLAYDVARELGRVFQEVYGGIKNIVKAAFPSGPESGAGKVMLDFLHSISRGFQNFTGSTGFSTWLKESTTNAVVALKTLGKFLKIFVDLAGNKDTREFWMTLQGAVPYIKQILEAGQKAGKSFAEVLVSLSKMVAIVAEDATLTGFFNTLKSILDAFAHIIELLAPIFRIIGMFHGPLLAIVGVFLVLKKGLEIFLGLMSKVTSAFGALTAKLTADKQALGAYRHEMEMAKQAGQNLFNQLRTSARTARNSQLLTMGREAGFARDRLAQLELQLISGSKAAYLYNEQTKMTTTMLQMSIVAKKGAITEAQLMTNRILQQASAAGFDAQAIKLLNDQIQRNILEARQQGLTTITNQSLIRGTGLANSGYKAAYANTLNAPGPAGLPMAPSTMVGAPGIRGFVGTVGAGIRGGFGRLGGGSALGGFGMAGTMGSSLYAMGSGSMSQVGMMMHGIAGVASMFGPAGMVTGALLSVGTTIVDSMNKAEAERLKKIREFRITTANMVVSNLNQVQSFGEKAAAAGLAGTRAEAEYLSANKFLAAVTRFNQEYDLSINDFQGAIQEFALANKQAYTISGREGAANVVARTIGEIKKTSSLDINSIAGALGSVSAMTSKTSKTVLNEFVKTGIIGQDQVAGLLENLKFDTSGLLTNTSFAQLMTKIQKASAQEGVTVPGAPGGPTQTDIIPLKYKTAVFDPYASYAIPKMSASVQADVAQSLSGLMGQKRGELFSLAGGKVTFKDAQSRATIQSYIGEISEALTGVTGSITRETMKIAGRDTKGLNVAGKFFTFYQFQEAIKNVKLAGGGSAGDAFNIQEIGQLGLVGNAITNPLIATASQNAQAQATAFNNSTKDVKAAAIEIGKAAAKFDGYGEIIANSTNKAIAYAMVSNTTAGKAAIENNNERQLTTLINQQLRRLGLTG